MLTTPIDVEASHATFNDDVGFVQWHAGMRMWKTADDLDRYRKVIEATRPEVMVETGTRWGGFAAWVADEFAVEVLTVDVNKRDRPARWPGVAFVTGDSADPRTAAAVVELVGNRRCMVSLDSDHHAGHVMREIEGYQGMVSPGCYLVVEDGLADLVGAKRARRFGQRIPVEGGPLRAIEASTLTIDPNWERDLDIEGLTPVSHHPAGWWRRVR